MHFPQILRKIVIPQTFKKQVLYTKLLQIIKIMANFKIKEYFN